MSFVCALCIFARFAFSAPTPPQTFSGSANVDGAIEQAIREDRIPGAVLIVGRDGETVYRKAYGRRAVVPHVETMTDDTIFDCASLTKVIATTSSIMKLFEAGKLRLDDRVTEYLPDFQGGKSGITIRNLMTHFSGMRPDLDLKPAWSGYETGIRMALSDKPAAAPGERFVYSDINFILLGEIVRRLSGQALDIFAQQNIFEPLGMSDSMFRPPVRLRDRIAPTEAPLRGLVHDPTARFMGGVAGHAGLFSTAADLARFCDMMLGKGSRQGRNRRRISPSCAGSAGISIRPIPPTAASCFPSALTATRVSRGHPCGSIPSAELM
jgi:CubicO group peptidase (beta-lactamase class C family)